MDARVRCGGQWLDQVAEVSSIEFSHVFRRPATSGQDAGFCGSHVASCDLTTDLASTPPYLLRGQRFEVYVGGRRVWSGVATEPQVDGRTWRLAANGLGVELARYPALAEVEVSPGVFNPLPTTVPDDAFDWAVSEGLPLTRVGSLGTDPLGSEDGKVETLADLLLLAATNEGKRLLVDVQGFVSFVDDPTTTGWLLEPGYGVMGTADENYLSHLRGFYVSAATGTPPVASEWRTVVAEDTLAADRWGRVEKVLDLTKLGVLSSVDAQAFVDGRFALVGARMGYTNAVEATDMTLSHVSGAPADLADVAVSCGTGARLKLLAVRDENGTTRPTATQEVTLGEVRWRDESLYLAPEGLIARDFTGALQVPEPAPVVTL